MTKGDVLEREALAILDQKPEEEGELAQSWIMPHIRLHSADAFA